MNISRRSFIKGVAAGAAAPLVLTGSAWAAKKKKPNELLNLALIGVGKQNRDLLGNFLFREIKVVAVCDVDTTRRDHAVDIVKKFHAEHPDRAGAFDCKGYNDFREIIERKDVDAVCIATPDHWHAIPTLAALNAGKDVYCEKPLTHNLHESIEVMKAVKKNKRVLQTGSMQRSMGEFRVACELVRNGVIGKISRVNCKVGAPGRPCDLPEEPAEPGLDWDRWLGPAPVRPYNSVLSPRGNHNHYPDWRSYLEFGGGAICDWGAHHFDIAQWGLGMDESGPIEVRPPEQPDALTGAVMIYDNGVTVTQVSDGFDVHFFGEDGEVKVSRGGFEMVHGGETITNHNVADKKFLKDPKVKLYRSKSHTDDFLERVADRKRPVTSEVEGGHSSICCHLVNLAYYHRQTIKWNPDKLKFADPSCDPAWFKTSYREPWKV